MVAETLESQWSMVVHSGCCVRPPRSYWLKHHVLMHHAGRAVRHWLDTMGETDGPAVSGRDFFLAEPPEPRRKRRNSRTAHGCEPPPPRSHLLLPRDLVSLLFACLRCLPVVFLPSVSNGAAGVRSSSKKRVGSGPRGLGPDGSSVVLSQSVYFAQRGGVVESG